MNQNIKSNAFRVGMALNKMGYLVPDTKISEMREQTAIVEDCVGVLISEIERLEKKLESNREEVESEDKEMAKSKMCDGYCQFPNITGAQEDLDAICEGCPLNRL